MFAGTNVAVLNVQRVGLRLIMLSYIGALVPLTLLSSNFREHVERSATKLKDVIGVIPHSFDASGSVSEVVAVGLDERGVLAAELPISINELNVVSNANVIQAQGQPQTDLMKWVTGPMLASTYLITVRTFANDQELLSALPIRRLFPSGAPLTSPCDVSAFVKDVLGIEPYKYDPSLAPKFDVMAALSSIVNAVSSLGQAVQGFFDALSYGGLLTKTGKGGSAAFWKKDVGPFVHALACKSLGQSAWTVFKGDPFGCPLRFAKELGNDSCGVALLLAMRLRA